MDISIVVIGDELLIGQVTDTNSGFIARNISPFGWQVRDVQVVADNAEAITSAIDRAFSRSRVVVTTGGLGPTKDDITKEALRTYFGGEMQFVGSVLDNVKEIFRKRGLQLNDLTASQAMVPTSARVIQNRVGTAPIMWFEDPVRERVLVAMPGVPFETREMFTTEVFPQLAEKFPTDGVVEHRTIMVEGISESDLATLLGEWEASLPDYIHLAYLPKPGLIRLRLDGHYPYTGFLDREINRYAVELKSLCGEHFLYDGDREPAEILLEKLAEKNLTVATAESCTGGNIAHLITSVPGSSASMLGGVVSYSNDVKRNLLGVSAKSLDEHGAVSIPVVEQMALGACNATGADIAMATSGIAGPGGGSEEKPVGTVCIAVATRNGITSHTFRFPGSRDRVIDRASVTAIIMAIRATESLSPAGQ